MSRFVKLVYVALSVLSFANLRSEIPPNDLETYQSKTGLQGSYNQEEKVFKVTVPRNDIKISVDNRELDPFMGLTIWVAFTPIKEDQYMVMGDLVLLQEEVNPLISFLLANGFEVTALHNHFFYDHPKVYFMHIAGEGSLPTLAGVIKKALAMPKATKDPATSFEGSPILSKNSINSAPLEKIFGVKGQTKEGMVKFVFGRTVHMNKVSLGKEMGVNTWAAFAGSDQNALVDGDFAVSEKELKPVLQTLRKGNINIVAIHHHMIMEEPRTIFLHFWGKGNAEELAKTIEKALSLTSQK